MMVNSKALRNLFTRVKRRSHRNKFNISVTARQQIRTCGLDYFFVALIVTFMQILHKSTNVPNYTCDNIFKHLTFTLIGDNEENIFVVCWMRLNGLETQMNKTFYNTHLYTPLLTACYFY